MSAFKRGRAFADCPSDDDELEFDTENAIDTARLQKLMESAQKRRRNSIQQPFSVVDMNPFAVALPAYAPGAGTGAGAGAGMGSSFTCGPSTSAAPPIPAATVPTIDPRIGALEAQIAAVMGALEQERKDSALLKRAVLVQAKQIRGLRDEVEVRSSTRPPLGRTSNTCLSRSVIVATCEYCWASSRVEALPNSGPLGFRV